MHFFPREPLWLEVYILLIFVCVFTHRNIMFIYTCYRKKHTFHLHFKRLYIGATITHPSPRSHPWLFATLRAYLCLRGRRISTIWKTIGSYSTWFSVTTIWCPLRDYSSSWRILRIEGALARLGQIECCLYKCHSALGGLWRVWIPAFLSKTNLVITTHLSCYRTFGFSSKNSFKINSSEWPQKENFK